ncbi:AbrB/MazE/SpoVT family DNA-binding domain-containing protein [Halobacterium salinarum]|jgi:bifunctional DNA-binding transcriptional regulator/antitoxin component of YhaV-PrlF toxin-antitoxin module|uniref:AbrB/MazE/SpoVT family DNA-binding domain-containing protein n=1 Tax=Halobacterium salinarum TaxID=2242 RepID=UPI002553120B|nr:AbrB/MazE/SpoVT family DNA-binding domain-containing protein [Halobacterium salinarum]MDL0133708.1 AbrB/MazE/SpoVT family DNA-binding domain-containing protein [Halobacterium salinarum]
MAEKIEIGRQQPLQMDSRGRVTIPSNIRQKHDIQPEDGKEVWIEVDLKWAEVEQTDSEDDAGDA